MEVTVPATVLSSVKTFPIGYNLKWKICFFFSPTVFLAQFIAHLELQALVVITITTSLIRKFLREQGCILLCSLRGHRQLWRKHEAVHHIKFRVRKPTDVNSCPQIFFTPFIQLKTPGEGVLPIAFRVALFASGKSFPQM